MTPYSIDQDLLTTSNPTFDGAQLTGTLAMDAAPINEAAEFEVSSSATTAIGAAPSNNVRVAGSTTITAFDVAPAGVTRRVRFTGGLTLTHSAALQLPGNANITTASGDCLIAQSMGSGTWKVMFYQAQSGLVPGLGTMATQNASSVAITGGTLNSVAITNSTFTADAGGLKVEDSNGDTLSIATGELTTNRTFTIDPVDATRTLTIAADVTLDQSVATASSPQFAGVNVGHASDTTLSRAAAGQIAVEGVNVLASNASGVQTFLTAPSSANLAATVTDEIGTGSLLFGNQPVSTGSSPHFAKVGVTDPDQSNALFLDAGDNLTADRTLTITADSAINQDVRTSAVPVFSALKISTSGSGNHLQFLGNSGFTADRNLTVGLGDSNRTVAITGDATISQDYSTSGAPRFAALAVDAALVGNERVTVNQPGNSPAILWTHSGTSSNAISGSTSGASAVSYYSEATNGSYAGSIYVARSSRTAATAFNFLFGQSGGGSDNEVLLRGDGTILSDNAATTPADYAELFENAKLGVLGLGESVVLLGGKVALARNNPALAVVGVVRPKGASAVVANTHWSRHHKKYVRDKWGAYVTDESGNVIKSASHDDTRKYVPRGERPAEWTIVGLLGQIPILQSAPKAPHWIKMWDIDPETEMWLVR